MNTEDSNLVLDSFSRIFPGQRVDSISSLIGGYVDRHGRSNLVTRVDCADGASYVVKALRKYPDDAALVFAAEQRLAKEFNLIAAKRGSRLRVPEMYGDPSASAQPLRVGETIFLVQDFLRGRPLDWDESYGFRAPLIAAAAAELHDILRQLDPSLLPLGAPRYPPDVEAIHSRLTAMQERPELPPSPQSPMLRELLPELQTGVSYLLSEGTRLIEALPQQLIHGDLAPIHLQLSGDPGSEQISGVIDWDRLCVGSRLWDFSRRIFPVARWDDQRPAIRILISAITDWIASYQRCAEKLGHSLTDQELKAIPLVLACAELDKFSVMLLPDSQQCKGRPRHADWFLACGRAFVHLLKESGAVWAERIRQVPITAGSPPKTAAAGALPLEQATLRTLTSDRQLCPIALAKVGSAIQINSWLPEKSCYNEARIKLPTPVAVAGMTLELTAALDSVEFDALEGGPARATACLSLVLDDCPCFGAALPAFRKDSKSWSARIAVPATVEAVDEIVLGFSATQGSLRRIALSLLELKIGA